MRIPQRARQKGSRISDLQTMTAQVTCTNAGAADDTGCPAITAFLDTAIPRFDLILAGPWPADGQPNARISERDRAR